MQARGLILMAINDIDWHPKRNLIATAGDEGYAGIYNSESIIENKSN